MYPQDKNTFIHIFSTRLRTAMEANNMKQKDLADIVGVRQTTVSDYLNMKVVPAADVFLRIAAALGVAADYLAGVNPDAPPPEPTCDLNLARENAILQERLKTLGAAIRAVLDDYKC